MNDVADDVTRYVLPNGVRIEKFHSIQLKVSGSELIKISDWDLKQSIRKLDSRCSDPLYESITRHFDSKALSIFMVYEGRDSADELSRKIDLMRNKIKINAQILHVEVVSAVGDISDSKSINSIKAVWLRNLPIRWFELDSFQGSCAVPSAHIVYSFLQENFGVVDQMETKSPKDGKGTLLQIDLCIKFSNSSSCTKLMDVMGARSCIARRDGASIVFPITAELDMSDYLSSDLVAQRASLRDKVRSCRAELKREAAALSLALDDAELYLSTPAIQDMLVTTAIKSEYEDVVHLCVKYRVTLGDYSISDSSSALDEEVPKMRSRSKELQSATSIVTQRKSSLGQSAALEQLSRKVKAQKEAEELLQIELLDLRTRAKDCLLSATDMSASGKSICDLHKWGDVADKLFPRVDILSTTLSQLLKNQGGGAKYMGVLKKSFSSLDSYLQSISPVIELLSGFNVLTEYLEKTKRELFPHDASPSVPSDTAEAPLSTADIAKNTVRNLISEGNKKMDAFLVRIVGWKNEWESEGNSEQHAGLKSVLDDGDMCNQEELLKIAQAVDVLLKVHSQLQDAASVAQSILRSFGATADPDPGNQTSDSGDSNPVDAADRGRDRDRDIGVRARGSCLCFTGCCICSGAELEELRRLFKAEIMDPYDYRMSRIAVLLRSDVDTLLEPSFHTGLRNSVETGCNLLQIGVEEHEQDKRELVIEAKRIEEDRLLRIQKQEAIEAERLKRLKEDNRALLEKKIAILKAKKKELEEVKEEEKRSSEVQVREGFPEAEERHSMDVSARDEHRREQPTRTDRWDSERDGGRDRDYGRDRDEGRDRNNGRDRDEGRGGGMDWDGGRDRDGERDRDRGRERGRYDERHSNCRPREVECEKGIHIYALQPPPWDLDPSMDEGACMRNMRRRDGHVESSSCSSSSSSSSRDDQSYGIEGEGDEAACVGQKRRLVLSAVGHTSATGDRLILSALRRTIGQGGAGSASVPASVSVPVYQGGSNRTVLESGDVAGNADQEDAPDLVPVEPLQQVVTMVALEVDTVSNVEDSALRSPVMADALKQESHMREALLATKLKNRKLLRKS